ncbi:hypothetical protein NC981_21630 [Leptolyngbya sp. DQ-M1]|uniref:hypothetical protein n=1 Tax=Leptolyngbya sp. DQ-M1 TaxID=2933920 RepID=UPI0032984BF0
MDDPKYPERLTIRLTKKDAALLKSIARQESTDMSSLTRRGLMLLIREKAMLNRIAVSAHQRGISYPIEN